MKRLLAGAFIALTFAAPVQAATIRSDCCEGPDTTYTVTSGSLRWSSGSCLPSRGQFRMHTTASYGNASMSARFYLTGWNTTDPYISPTSSTGVPLRGVLVMARWRSPDSLYYIAVERSAGYGQKLEVSKKEPIPGCVSSTGVQCGTYHRLARFPRVTPERFGWHSVRVEVADSLDGISVRIRVWYDGYLAGTVWDDGSRGGPALRGTGRFGWRSDNAYWKIDSATWSSVAPAPVR